VSQDHPGPLRSTRLVTAELVSKGICPGELAQSARGTWGTGPTALSLAALKYLGPPLSERLP